MDLPERASRRRRIGLSIMQVGAILVVVSMAASVGIRHWFDQPAITLDNAARLLAADLRDAQNRAAMEGRTLTLRFRPEGDGYAVVDDTGEPVRAPVGSGPFLRDYDFDAVFRGVWVESVSLGPEDAVRFGPYGLTESRGEVVLAFGEERRTVRLLNETGALAIDGLSQPWRDDGF